MKKTIALLVVSLLAITFNSPDANAKVNTADFWKCESRQGGSWTVGRAASICLVKPFQQPSEVQSYWSQVTYDDVKYNSSTNIRKQENSRYSTEMNALVEGFASQYYVKRNPAAKSDEIEAWMKAILAVSYHESIWTHYRKGTDGQMRMLRGDFGHGHGLMQVDDRWHFAYVSDGGAARLQDNMIYGLDLFYSLWTKAGKASCVGGSSNYLARTRATYSMYNGGEGSVCRWKNTSHKWYKNDKNFWDHFQKQGWRQHVTNASTFKYNFSCLVQDGGLKCFDSEIDPRPPVAVPNPISNPAPINNPSSAYKYLVDNIYILKSRSLYCTWNNQFLSCLPAQLGTQCLIDLFGIDSDNAYIDLEAETTQIASTRMINPETKCIPSGEINVGDYISTQANINLRKTPGGAKLITVPKNRNYQVLNIYRNEKTNISYYLISAGSSSGYIHIGTPNEAKNFVKKSYANAAEKILAAKGEMIEVKNISGINMRKDPGGSLQLNIPARERLVVLSRILRGEEGHVYYKVEYKNTIGYVYSGRLAPIPNIKTWTEVK